MDVRHGLSSLYSIKIVVTGLPVGRFTLADFEHKNDEQKEEENHQNKPIQNTTTTKHTTNTAYDTDTKTGGGYGNVESNVGGNVVDSGLPRIIINDVDDSKPTDTATATATSTPPNEEPEEAVSSAPPPTPRARLSSEEVASMRVENQRKTAFYLSEIKRIASIEGSGLHFKPEPDSMLRNW